MNRDLCLAAWLVGCLLCLSVVFNGYFVFENVMVHRDLVNQENEVRKLPPVFQYQAIVRNLMSDLMAYGQKQPAIFSVLQKYGLRPPPKQAPSSAAAPSKPTPPIPSP